MSREMKLVILNGPSGVGKSTLAERLHRDMPLSVLIEVDAWRRFISGYREHKEESLTLAYRFSLAAAEACLEAGRSVIVDKAVLDADPFLDSLYALGTKHTADIREFLLIARKETLLKRADERGLAPDSLLTREKVVELGEKAHEFKQSRSQAIVVDTEELSPDAVYDRVRETVFQK
jgi:predicted kinase